VQLGQRQRDSAGPNQACAFLQGHLGELPAVILFGFGSPVITYGGVRHAKRQDIARTSDQLVPPRACKDSWCQVVGGARLPRLYKPPPRIHKIKLVMVLRVGHQPAIDHAAESS
jgi:hypothetical protein